MAIHTLIAVGFFFLLLSFLVCLGPTALLNGPSKAVGWCLWCRGWFPKRLLPSLQTPLLMQLSSTTQLFRFLQKLGAKKVRVCGFSLLDIESEREMLLTVEPSESLTEKKKKEAHYLDTALPAISRSVKHYRCCSITRPLRFCTSVIWDCFFFPSSVVVCYSYTSTTSTPTSTPVPSGSVATVKSPRPASPASNVVVLPSGSAVYVKSKWEKKHYFKPKIGV